MWMDGPLKYDKDEMKWKNMPNKEVALKCLYNSQNIINKFLNEVSIKILILCNSI
jgi:hypothetical protein